jgi:methylenetetrahydrofolate--tRNA-(uracil-5-)-methyltransferase
VESASVGIMAARFAAAEKLGHPLPFPPKTTAMGSLLNHITGGANADTFQPMNINFGLFPELTEDEARPEQANGKRKKLKGMDRKKAYTSRALNDLETWLQSYKLAA